MNINDLHLFLHLSETLHFGKTSRACHLSPSSLSRIVKRLEEEVDAELFERDRRVVRLTEAGDHLRTYARSVLDGWGELKERLDENVGRVRGEVRLYCSVTASYSILPDILGRFRTRFPEVHIKLVTGDANLAIDRVVEDAVDIAVAAVPDRVPRNILTRVVTRSPLVFIAGNDSPVGVPPKERIEWGQVPMILPESGLIRSYLMDWFRAKGLTPNVYGEVAGHEGILSLVSLGLGVGVVPRLVLERSMIQTQVRELRVKPALPDFRIGFCTTRGRLGSSPVRAFWEMLEEV